MDYRAHLRRRLVEQDIPATLHEGLIEYFAARRPTGGFLQAVLENNLRQACIRADDVNRYELASIVLFLHNYVPSPAWGSHEAVEAWLTDTAPVPEIFE
jgi:hypothetical protein